MPAPECLPVGIRQLAFSSGLPVRADPDFERDITRLIKHLEEQLGFGNDDLNKGGKSGLSRGVFVSLLGITFASLLAGATYLSWGFNSVETFSCKIQIPRARVDGSLSMTGNDSSITRTFEIRSNSQDFDQLSSWFDDTIKDRYPKSDNGQNYQFFVSKTGKYPEGLVVIFWHYNNISDASNGRMMASQSVAGKTTFAFVGCPFFQPQMIAHELESETPQERMEVYLEPGGDVPVVLNCDNSGIRFKVEKRLKDLGYDIHGPERLESLKESTKLLSAARVKDPAEKFEEIKQSYVYAILNIEIATEN